MEKEKKTASYDFGSFEKDSLTRPRDKAWSSWVSWDGAEIGAKVQGYIRDAFWRPEEMNEDGSVAFRAQRGITLEKVDGTLVNLGIKSLPFVLVMTDNLRIGDPLTVVYEGDGEKKKKSWNAPKLYGYYGKNLPENAGNPTVKELTDADKAIGGTVSSFHEEEEVVANEVPGADGKPEDKGSIVF